MSTMNPDWLHRLDVLGFGAKASAVFAYSDAAARVAVYFAVVAMLSRPQVLPVRVGQR
jgi:hypothetical protein